MMIQPLQGAEGMTFQMTQGDALGYMIKGFQPFSVTIYLTYSSTLPFHPSYLFIHLTFSSLTFLSLSSFHSPYLFIRLIFLFSSPFHLSYLFIHLTLFIFLTFSFTLPFHLSHLFTSLIFLRYFKHDTENHSLVSKYPPTRT